MRIATVVLTNCLHGSGRVRFICVCVQGRDSGSLLYLSSVQLWSVIYVDFFLQF